jgi:hypothetical protein
MDREQRRLVFGGFVMGLSTAGIIACLTILAVIL